MSTFVLPLPGGDMSPPSSAFSLENTNDLISYINSSAAIREMLEIDFSVGHGVWKTYFDNYVVVAEIKVTIGEALDKPWIDSAMKMDWGKYKPTEEEWDEYRLYFKRQLAMIIKSASGDNVDPNNITFRVRRKTSKGAKVFMVYC